MASRPATTKKTVISSVLENVGHGHYLQKSSYLVYYMIDFNQSFAKMMQLQLAAKASFQLTFKMQIKVTFHRVIPAIIKPIWTFFLQEWRVFISLP